MYFAITEFTGYKCDRCKSKGGPDNQLIRLSAKRKATVRRREHELFFCDACWLRMTAYFLMKNPAKFLTS